MLKIITRTSSNISAKTCLKLANDFNNIVAVKEASGDMGQIMEILRERPENFSVLSGDDALTFPMMALGADGVISVIANTYPSEFTTMINALNYKDLNVAKKIHYSLLPFIELLFADGNPAGVKASLEVLGILENNLRLPILAVEKALYARIESFINSYAQL